jgi:hypothetical protein
MLDASAAEPKHPDVEGAQGKREGGASGHCEEPFAACEEWSAGVPSSHGRTAWFANAEKCR